MSRYDFEDEMDRIEDEQDFDNEAYNELDDLDDYYDSEDQLGLPPYMDHYDEEITRLTKKIPRTKAEKAFHAWLSEWRKRTHG